MNQSELVSKVASISGETKKTVEFVFKTTADVIAAEINRGGEVTLPGIGKLQAKNKPARTGRNPATGETIQIEAKRVPHFTAAKALKDALIK